MLYQARTMLVGAALVALVGGTACGQESPRPAAPAPPPPPPVLQDPVAAPPPAPAPPAGQLVPPPPPVVHPAPPPLPSAPYCPDMRYPAAGGPPACAPNEDCNGNLLRGDPFLDPACQPAPGWFAAVELDIVGAHITNHLVNTVNILGMPTLVHLPTADLDWTASPRLEVGYRFDQGFGEVLLAYHSLVTEGRQVLPDFDGGTGGGLKSRLNLNAVDLDYASREFSLLPRLGMKWRAGVTYGNVYFDSQAVGATLEERTSNSFWGIGPNAGLDLTYHFCKAPALSVFTRLDGSVLLGQVHQSFEEVAGVAGVGLVGDAVRQSSTRAVPTLHFQAGLGYMPTFANRQLYLSMGYEFEKWWLIGDVGDSSADLTSQGLFFRAEFNY